jgi:hypothetical protein
VNACVYYEQGFKQWLFGEVWVVCVVVFFFSLTLKGGKNPGTIYIRLYALLVWWWIVFSYGIGTRIKRIFLDSLFENGWERID